jgi:hypothetical protein
MRPDGEAILGMQLFVDGDADLQALFKGKNAGADWVTAPNNEPLGSRNATTARHHGDFDNDTATVQATLARILDKKNIAVTPSFSGTALSHQTRRGYIANASK